MDALPLTPNGKLDRRALPEPDQARLKLESAYVAARTPTEQTLVDIWKEVLKVEQVGVNDNFFDLGGIRSSPSTWSLQIEAGFGKKIPLSELFRTPTISSLATVLRQDVTPAVWNSLVPVHTSGSRPALFLIHGHQGNGISIRIC